MSNDNWGRWGSDDQVGTPNLVGAEQVLAALLYARRGQVVTIGQTLGPGTPVPPHRKRIERYMARDGGDYAAGARRPDGFQFAEDVVSFASHSGTHVDALCHVFYDDRLFNGFPAASVRSTTGAQKCGAETLTAIVTRGLLLDIVTVRGRPLARAEPITAEDLRAAEQHAGTQIRPGDAVLIRTGWLNSSRADEGAYFASEPGIDVGAARWLADADVAIIGADNYAIEQQPSPAGSTFPVHQLLIRDFGIPLLEGAELEELAAADPGGPFLFVSTPLRIVGGTAGPTCPIAVL
jgi:kynurenine formamidase